VDVAREEIQAEGTRAVRRAKLNIVDLAGSERHGNLLTGNSRETGSINKSLFCLTSVVQALVGNEHGNLPRMFVPYRDSKLTYLLRDSLGGNTKTSFVLVADPSNSLYSRSTTTHETLSFGERLLLVKNHAVVNETLKVNATVETLTAEIRLLKTQLCAYQNMPRSPAEEVAMKTNSSVREFRLQALLVGLLDRVKDAERRAAEFKAQAASWETQAQAALKSLEALEQLKTIQGSSSPTPVYHASPAPPVGTLFPNFVSLETPFKRQSGSFTAPFSQPAVNVSMRSPSPVATFGHFPPPPLLTPRSYFSPTQTAHSAPSAQDEVRVLRQLLENHPERAKRAAAEQRAVRAEQTLADERRRFEEYKSLEQQQLRILARSQLLRTKSSRQLITTYPTHEGEQQDGISSINIQVFDRGESDEMASLKVRLELAEEEIAHLLATQMKFEQQTSIIRS
jgi:hypothetical protein